MTQDPRRSTAEINAALAPLSRRRFLKTTLWATAGVAAVAAGGFAWLRRSPQDSLPVPDGLQVLTPSHYHLFHSLAAALLPTQGTAFFPVDQVPVAQHVDGLLAALDPAIRQQLGTGLSLIDNAAVFRHGKRLVDLAPAEAQAFVSDWVNSGVLVKRALGGVVSRLVHTGYWMDERTWPAIEFDGAVSAKWGIPARGNQPLPA